MANLKDVAELANVSIMTVSRVLNGKGYVSEEKRQRVLECAEQLHYRPNMMARSLVLNQSSTVGVLLSHIENPVYAQYVASMAKCFRDHNFDIILYCADTRQSWNAGIQSLLSKQVDGFVILPIEIDDMEDMAEVCASAQELLHSNGKPYVVVGDMPFPTPAYQVCHDYQQGAKMATEYLIQRGHRNIGCLRHMGGGLWAERLQGFEEAMENAGLSIRPEWVYSCEHDDIRCAMKATEKMLGRVSEPPTALYCANDAFAVGAMQALNARGIRVPEDISLIGHDGNIYSRCTSPFLTTVSIQPNMAGCAAAARLLALLRGERGDGVATERIAPLLQEGGTVKPIGRRV